jgi:hypothetical protein
MVTITRIEARRAEIKREHRRRLRGRQRPTMAHLRVGDLTRIFRARYGRALPNDDSGKHDAELLANHVASKPGDQRKNITHALWQWAPWMADVDIERCALQAIHRRQKWTADKLAKALGLRQSSGERSA